MTSCLQAVLLVGFQAEDFDSFQGLMLDMDADMVSLHCCDAAMLAGTLREALTASSPGWRPAPLGTRRAVILSGMYTAEVLDVVGAYRDASLPAAVFAATVPNNYEGVVSELVDEIFSDDKASVRHCDVVLMRVGSRLLSPRSTPLHGWQAREIL